MFLVCIWPCMRCSDLIVKLPPGTFCWLILQPNVQVKLKWDPQSIYCTSTSCNQTLNSLTPRQWPMLTHHWDQDLGCSVMSTPAQSSRADSTVAWHLVCALFYLLTVQVQTGNKNSQKQRKEWKGVAVHSTSYTFQQCNFIMKGIQEIVRRTSWPARLQATVIIHF